MDALKRYNRNELDEDELLTFLIEKFRHEISKTNWHDTNDIYELDFSSNKEVGLIVYGGNGRWYSMSISYQNGSWVITMCPKDPTKTKIWYGFGKGWEDV